jgi:hypothetical protein
VCVPGKAAVEMKSKVLKQPHQCLERYFHSLFYKTNKIVYRELLRSAVAQSGYSDLLRAGRQRGRSSNPGRVKNFHFFISSRTDLGPTQRPIQWVPGLFPLEIKRPESETQHIQLVPRSEKLECMHPLPTYTFTVWCLIS